MANIKVNVVLAGRTYPLSVKDTNEEQGMRSAAKNINDLIAKFEQSYAVSDKQDVLAMCALQFAAQVEQKSIDKEFVNESYKHEVFVPPRSEQLLLLGMLCAVIICWPAKLFTKLFGVLVGGAIFYVFDVARVCALMLVQIYYPLQFEIYSVWLAPIVYVLVLGGYFLAWKHFSSPN